MSLTAGQGQETGVVLTIAGSDPSGGAGVQADLKTFACIGVYGCAAITCLTAQNTLGVRSFVPVDPEFLREQVELVLEDLTVTHIKIGMVGTAAVARELGAILAGFSGEVIYDPVMVAKGGSSLAQAEAQAAIEAEVVSRATILTPNAHELLALAGQDQGDPIAMAQSLLRRFSHLRGVVVKGGHLAETSAAVTDTLVLRSPGQEGFGVFEAQHPRIASRNTHGTGCTFASAFTAFHLLFRDDQTAFRKAVDFVAFLVTASAFHGLGHGHGPLLHHLWQTREQLKEGEV